MNDLRKIEIAQKFLALHKSDNIDQWVLDSFLDLNEDQAHLLVFRRLQEGVYGDVRGNTEYDDNGEVAREADVFEIEIDRFDSKSGNPIIFEWGA